MKKISVLMHLNKEQECLLDIDKDYIVQAGAGSGKTRVLVSRYLQILESGVSANQIVAITFTVNAANEMKERIKKFINEYIGKYGESGGIKYDTLKDIADSPISTIHGFASRIIRENPYECNLSSRINVLEGLEKKQFLDECINEYLGEKFKNDKNLKEVLDFENYNVPVVKERIFSLLELVSRYHITIFEETSEAGEIESEIKKLHKSLNNEIKYGPHSSANKKLNKKLGEFHCLIDKLEQSNYIDCLDILNRSKLVLSNQGSPKGILELNASNDIEKRYAATCADIIGKIINLYDIRCTNRYIKLFSDFNDYYRERKNKNGYMEYEDLLMTAHNLFLNSPEILESYREKYKYFLIDEFQDTDSLQYNIISLFSDSSNTFIVGDPNQSIFGFRGAKPELFQGLQKSHDISSLSINYRSNYKLINFYNEAFRTIIKKSYKNMEFVSSDGGELHVKEAICTDVNKSDNKTHIESIAVANKILDLLKQGYGYKDIAILMRSKSNMAYFENALSRLSIPYYSSERSGFYRREEIRDVISFLKYLLNQNNKICEASVLRSTFVGATDTELFIHYVKKEMVELIDQYLEFLDGLRKELLPRNPLEILHAILSITYYQSAVRTLPNGDEKYQSINSLIEIFSNLQLQGKNLSEIIDYLDKNYEENIEGLSQLEMDESDTVKILTVHKAKGLEFPVVILADINHGMGGRNDYVDFSQTYGIIVRNSYVKSKIWDEIQEEQTLSAIDEEKRSLYVAMTRAREKLVFSVVSGIKPQRGSYLEILNEVLPISKIENGQKNIEFNNWDIPVLHYEIDDKPLNVEDFKEIEDIAERELILESYDEYTVQRESLEIPELSIYTNKMMEGSVVHRFLEIWNYEEEDIDIMIKYVLNEFYITNEKMYELLRVVAGNFLNSELFQIIKEADLVKKELPFYIELEGKNERRKIDLLVIKNNTLNLYDYKLSKEIKIEYIEQMNLYEKALVKKYDCHDIKKYFVHLPQVVINSIN